MLPTTPTTEFEQSLNGELATPQEVLKWALEEFGKDLAPKFITACVARDRDGIAKSSIKVMWEETQPKTPCYA